MPGSFHELTPDLSSIPASTALPLSQPHAKKTREEPRSLAPGRCDGELGRGYKQAPSRTPFLGNSRKPCQWGFTPAQPRWAQPISVNVARQLLQPAGQMQIGLASLLPNWQIPSPLRLVLPPYSLRLEKLQGPPAPDGCDRRGRGTREAPSPGSGFC